MGKNYDVLISYDLNTKHDSAIYAVVKSTMINKGYADKLADTANANTILSLPNTTLWKKNITAMIARTDLETCVAEYNIKNSVQHRIERCLSLEFTSNWNGHYGDPHQSSSEAPGKDRI